MPEPTPNPAEEHDEFMSRCMGDDTMLSEYDDEAQRSAVCQTHWDEKAKAVKAFTHNSTVEDDEPGWGSVNKTTLPRAAYADIGEADKVSSWTHPHHWIKGGGAEDDNGRYTTGAMFLHRGGLDAARAAAEGARAGEEAAPAVKAHLKAHADAIGSGEEGKDVRDAIVEPEDKKYTMTETKAVEVDMEARTAVFTINTNHVDRDQEVIRPSGVNMKPYRKNPIVLWGHDYQGLPIGKSLWERRVVIEGRPSIKAKVEFAPTEFATDILNLVQGGFLRSTSIGFIPEDMVGRTPTTKEIEKYPDWAQAKRIFDKTELLEFSIVTVPANPHALACAVMKGLRLPQGMTLGTLEDGKDQDETEVLSTDWGIDIWEKDVHEAICRPVEAFQAGTFHREAKFHDGIEYVLVSGMTLDTRRADGTLEPGRMETCKIYYPADLWGAERATTHGAERGATVLVRQEDRIRTIPKLAVRIQPEDVKVIEPLQVIDESVRVITTSKEIKETEDARARGRIIL